MKSQQIRPWVSLSRGNLRNAVGVGILVANLVSLITEATAQGSDNLVSITRSIERVVDGLLLDASGCNYSGKIVLGGFYTLESDDKFFSIGNSQLSALNLMVDEINRYECGVQLNGLGNFSLELRTYDDQSSLTEASEIGYKLAGDASIDVMIAGYSSTLTLPYVKIADSQSDKLVLAPGAASTNVFLDKPLAFGFVPPSNKYMEQAIEALATVNGAKTIATLWEDASFTRGVCGAAPGLAEQYGMTVTSTTEVATAPDVTVLEPIAETLKGEDPDVVITCVYDCTPWVKAMRKVKWSPKAQVFTVCIGQEKFSQEVGTDTAYIMGVTPWDSSLQVEDAVTGWTPKDFASKFRQALSDEETADVPYQAAMASALISVLYQTIEAVGDFRNNGPALAEYISRNSFHTVGGKYSFDENGQSKAPSLMVQYDADGEVQTVYPLEASSGPILYPMPSWDRRDCVTLSMCEVKGGNSTDDPLKMGNTCDDAGACVCEDTLHFQSVGLGATANCIQLEEMNYINRSLKVFSWVGCGFLLVFSAFALGWIYHYRENTLVRVSQPLFLVLLIAGSILSSLSIIPMGIETSYRDESDNIKSIDAACMSIPWLWGMGFAVTYSALFAKVWRVRKLYCLAARMRRRAVNYKDVYYIVAIVVVAQLIVLVAFQVVSPHTWQRDVIQDIDGYSIESIGRCNSEKGWWFFAGLVGMNVICLIVALVICWMTKNIPSDFAESNYIFLSVMFMFQILVLAVPVSAMVRDDVDVFFFIRVAAVFFQNFTVLALIFLPKMRRIYIGEDTASTVRNAMRMSMKSTAGFPSKDYDLKDTTFGYHRRRSKTCIRNHREGSNMSSTQVPQSAVSTRLESQSDRMEDEPVKSSAIEELEAEGERQEGTTAEDIDVAVMIENGEWKQ